MNLAFGTRSTLLDLIELLEQVLERPIAREHVETRRGDVRDSQAASDRLTALFPRVQPTDLATGLRATASWFQSAS